MARTSSSFFHQQRRRLRQRPASPPAATTKMKKAPMQALFPIFHVTDRGYNQDLFFFLLWMLQSIRKNTRSSLYIDLYFLHCNCDFYNFDFN
ncbi:hypothetical protein MRB53_026327 [Persea americana]|uniref:Uncharacterized protein n=1 Tax=Persea americana TaxID=3435 RepID=A0ACC2LID5_PERAE|nr:hypothetical protein MRB53_026327 [Persea americana]